MQGKIPNEDEMKMLAQKLCEDHGAESCEIRFEMPVEGKPDCYDEYFFRFGPDSGDDAEEAETEGIAGAQPAAA